MLKFRMLVMMTIMLLRFSSYSSFSFLATQKIVLKN